jgi:hypothetical protein
MDFFFILCAPIVKSVILTFLVRKSAKKQIFKHFLNSSKLCPRLPESYRHTQAILQAAKLF